ncbi:hypothetical protein MLD38_027888 [Melastoma candidum]|nr:hypothetical protein MLD38_027888 [Melastoma candidum]
MVGATASGVPMPYYYPPMGQPAPPTGGMMIGRPAGTVDPTTGIYGLPAAAAPPPSQAWQSVWQHPAPSEDASFGQGSRE